MNSTAKNGWKGLLRGGSLFVAIVFSGSLTGATAIAAGFGTVRVAAYDPSATYQGSHDTQRVYELVLGPREWKLSRRPAMVSEVTCNPARRALEQQGVWTGRLAKDGACRGGDETQWATGNYLNFLAGPEATDADL